jgi:glycosyltransferase involved in cell wall biosynthesis
MKILLQNSVFFPNVIGGAEMSSHLLGQELRKRGVAVDSVATTGRRGGGRELTTRPTADGRGRIFEAPCHGFWHIYENDGLPAQPNILVRGLHHFSSVASSRWKDLFGQVLAQVQPDVVHTNTIVGMTPTIWTAAHERGIPIVHTLRDYHLLCPRTTLLRSNNTDCENPPLPCKVLARLKLRQTHEVAVVTAPSRFVLDRHLQAGGFSNAHPRVVPNACEYLPSAVPERPVGGPVKGLYLGQLDDHKGLALLLAALETLFSSEGASRLQFDIAGSGPAVDRVQALCARFPERLRFHGVVKGQTKYDLLAGSSFQVVPSVWNDNFPRSILDGFSWGIPVIGTSRGGIPEVIRHDQDGLIISPDTGELARAMIRYLESPDLRRQHGTSARRRAEGYTLDHQVDMFQQIYDDLLSARETTP